MSITITCAFGGDSSLRDSASQTDVLWQIYTVLRVVGFGVLFVGIFVCFTFKFLFIFVSYPKKKSVNLYFRNMETRSVG